MKKLFLKTMAIFLALVIIQLQALAGSSVSLSSDDEAAVNFDETEIYASFDQINDLTTYVTENEAVTYTDVASFDNSMVANVSSTAALALNSNAGEPPIVSAFWWGCLLSWVGVIIVYVTTDSDSSYTKAAWKGCILSGIVYVAWGILWRVVWASNSLL
jgi:hypothetical protein